MGPVAQDFHAAFGLGTDDTHIMTVDSEGVALAAIQGLHQELKAKSRQLAQQRKAIEALNRKLAAIETKLALK